MNNEELKTADDGTVQELLGVQEGIAPLAVKDEENDALLPANSPNDEQVAALMKENAALLAANAELVLAIQIRDNQIQIKDDQIQISNDQAAIDNGRYFTSIENLWMSETITTSSIFYSEQEIGRASCRERV